MATTPEDGATFASRYTLGPRLGGCHAAVHQCWPTDDPTTVRVAKIVDASLHSADEKRLLESELAILKRVEHPNVVEVVEVFPENSLKQIVVVTEWVAGGELFDVIVERGHYCERDAVSVCRGLLRAIAYLHSLNIVHRDLKPENLLCISSGGTAVKICDFGVSKWVDEDTLLKTKCGTPEYVAPEVLQTEVYTASVDMWSVGVIVYMMLAGRMPFYGDTTAELFEKITRAEYEFDSDVWDDMSPAAKHFVQSLLVVDPEERLSAELALKHPWIALHASASTNHLFRSVESLRKSNSYRKRWRSSIGAVVTARRLEAGAAKRALSFSLSAASLPSTPSPIKGRTTQHEDGGGGGGAAESGLFDLEDEFAEFNVGV